MVHAIPSTYISYNFLTKFLHFEHFHPGPLSFSPHSSPLVPTKRITFAFLFFSFLFFSFLFSSFLPSFLLFVHSFFSFLGPHLQHMEVPRLGVCLELQLLTYTTSTVTRDPSSISYLHRSSWQHWILNSLSGASRILVVFVTCWATMRTPEVFFCELVCF